MPDTRLPSNVAQIVAVFVECIFYGIYLVTFAASLRSIASPRPELSWASRFKHRRPMLIIVLLLFVFSTLNLALGLLRILALIHHDVVGSGAAEQLGKDWVNILKPLSMNLQTMVADCVMIYRCWVVYSKSLRVVVLPIVLYFGGIACTLWSLVIQISLKSDEISRANGGRLLPLLTAFWASTIALNIYATSMIVLRIWRVESKSKGKNALTPLYVTPHLSRIQTAMKAVIESGLLYTVTTISVFFTHVTGSNAIYITSAADIQVIGIAFNLILIRAARHDEDTVITSSGRAVPTTLNFAHGVASYNFPIHDGQGVSTDRNVLKSILDSVPQAQGGARDRY